LNELAGRELALRQERRINPDVRGVGFCAQEPEFTEIVMFTLASLLAFALMVLIGIVLRFLIKMCCLERRISHFYQRPNAEIPLKSWQTEDAWTNRLLQTESMESLNSLHLPTTRPLLPKTLPMLKKY